MQTADVFLDRKLLHCDGSAWGATGSREWLYELYVGGVLCSELLGDSEAVGTGSAHAPVPDPSAAASGRYRSADASGCSSGREDARATGAAVSRLAWQSGRIAAGRRGARDSA